MNAVAESLLPFHTQEDTIWVTVSENYNVTLAHTKSETFNPTPYDANEMLGPALECTTMLTSQQFQVMRGVALDTSTDKRKV